MPAATKTRIARGSSSLARDPILQIGTHFAPGNRLARGGNSGIPLLGNVVEVAAPFLLIGFFGDRVENETVRGCACSFGRGDDTGFEVLRKANRGCGHGWFS